ncbi:hypothetical protein DEO72_LG3g1389 [Vigna unguiculata]|uniref:Uncharacterized protein n=1 Tax=Vigna unguiculata TaxID=3917 RepID=A0A4D6LE33_VIGUN|nr:hypothetical protein DEO72_LG3g1389 [Vigna unguiculata]
MVRCSSWCRFVIVCTQPPEFRQPCCSERNHRDNEPPCTLVPHLVGPPSPPCLSASIANRQQVFRPPRATVREQHLHLLSTHQIPAPPRRKLHCSTCDSNHVHHPHQSWPPPFSMHEISLQPAIAVFTHLQATTPEKRSSDTGETKQPSLHLAPATATRIGVENPNSGERRSATC